MGCRRRCGGALGEPGGCGGNYDRDHVHHTDVHADCASAVGSDGSEHVDQHVGSEHLDVHDFDEVHLDVDVEHFHQDGQHEQRHDDHPDDPRPGRVGRGLRAEAGFHPRPQPHQGKRGARQRVLDR
jgi:hypothetical protein